MTLLFEITAEDIAALGDGTLRELMGLLCQADYRRAGLPITGITFGGNQDATDGGFDVMVNSDFGPPDGSYILDRHCGFQVKKPAMAPAQIEKEMKPKGILRETINDLVSSGGGYVIASSGSNTTGTALTARVDKIKACLAPDDKSLPLKVDFLDRGRIATWVRSHPDMILWVRNKVGRELRGWQPFDNWSGAPGGLAEEYLVDDGIRISNNGRNDEESLSATGGLEKIREALSVPGTSVRLAGLSGFGKTRFVQALFDERVGQRALSINWAYYADMSDGPEPDPVSFARQLVASKIRAVLVIDNCPPDLHKRVSQICTANESTVSLITVEYDVRDDLPDETEVFRLVPASTELIVRLILQRFKYVGQVDAATIAEFSGGNARVAIALANTIQQGETVSGMRDEELFRRLFHQRNDLSESLMRSAEAISLVYSFEGTQTSSSSELAILGNFIDKSAVDLFRDVSTIQDRDLVQKRSVWRAVLPHAIANRLAKQALKSIPKDFLIEHLLSCGSDRVITSFARRLTYLHDCPEAVAIAEDWLAEGGWLSDLSRLGIVEVEIFVNVAPLVPDLALNVIERAVLTDPEGEFASRNNRQYYKFVKLLRSLAYDRHLFKRSAEIMIKFALSERRGESFNSVRDILKSLFFMRLSGTHATPEDRCEIVTDLLTSNSADRNALGLELLDCCMEAWQFSSHYDFAFGARPRDYGYYPTSLDEIRNWYKQFIQLSLNTILNDGPNSDSARRIFAEKFRGLWASAGMHDAVDEAFRKIQALRPWPRGWASVRQSLRFEGDSLAPQVKEKLLELELLMRPQGLKQLVETYALSQHAPTFDLLEDDDEPLNKAAHWSRAEEITEELGERLAESLSVLDEVVGDLVSKNGSKLFNLGQGLGSRPENRLVIWNKLINAIEKLPQDEMNRTVLLGFLHSASKSDPSFADQVLPDILHNASLAPAFVNFQSLAGINEAGLERLHVILENDIADISSFGNIAIGRAHEALSDEQLAGLISKISQKPDGVPVALDILKMRIHSVREKQGQLGPHLLQVGRQILSSYNFDQPVGRDSGLDHELKIIISACLSGADGAPAAKALITSLAQAISDNTVYVFNFYGVIGALAKLQPQHFLDIFLAGDELKKRQKERLFCAKFDRDDNPLKEIPDEQIVAWCEALPSERYMLAANAVESFASILGQEALEWTSVFFKIIENAPELKSVLSEIENMLIPSSYSGRLSEILQKRVKLLEKLFDHPNSELSAWAKRVHTYMAINADNIRQEEAKSRRSVNESFE